MSSTVILVSSDEEVNDDDDDIEFLGNVPPPPTDTDDVVCIGVFPHKPESLGKIEAVMKIDEGKWMMSQSSQDEVEVVFLGQVGNGEKELKPLPSSNVNNYAASKRTPVSSRRSSLLASTPPSLPPSISSSVKIVPKSNSRNSSYPSDSMTSIIIMNRKQDIKTTINIGHVPAQKRAQLQFLGPVENLPIKSEVSIRKVRPADVRESSPDLLRIDKEDPDVQFVGRVVIDDDLKKEEPGEQVEKCENDSIQEAEQMNSPSCSSGKRNEDDVSTEEFSGQEDEETVNSPFDELLIASKADNECLGGEEEKEEDEDDDDSKTENRSLVSDSNSSIDAIDSCSSSDRESLSIEELFEKFLKHCQSCENSDQMDKAKTKLRKYFDQSTKEVLSGPKLRPLLESSIYKLKGEIKENYFVLMKKVLELLKSQHQETERKVKKLEAFLQKINKKIKALEEAEVTSSEEEDSTYIQVDRYKRRAVLIYNKLCDLKAVPADADRVYLRKINFCAPDLGEGSSKMVSLCDSLSKTLQKYFNSTRKFPDFQDVKSSAKKICSKKDIILTPDKLHFVCQRVFESFAGMLQRRRMYDDYTICREYIDSDCDIEDPAKSDPTLAKKLSTNASFRSRESEVLQKYTILDMESKQSAVEEISKDRGKCERKKEPRKKKRKKINGGSNSSGDDLDSKTSDVSRKRTKDASDSE